MLDRVVTPSRLDLRIEVLGATALLLLRDRAGEVSGLALGVLLGPAVRTGLLLGGAGGVGVDLGVGLLLVRADDHGHVAPVLLGRGLDEAELLDVLGQLLQQAEAQLGTVLLAAAEHDRDLDLVARTQEPHDVTLLGLVVVLVDLGTKLHLLDDHVRLVAPGLAGLLGVLVLELPVVHELADRGASLRGDLDEVEVGLDGKLECLVGRHDANGLAVGSYEPDLGYADPVVDAQLGADGSSSGSVGGSPSPGPTGCAGNERWLPLLPSGSQSRHASPLGETEVSTSVSRRSWRWTGTRRSVVLGDRCGWETVVRASAWRDRRHREAWCH